MTNAFVTGQAVGGIVAAFMADSIDQVAMAVQTGVLGHPAIEWRDANGLGKGAGSESDTVPETVQPLNSVFGDDVVMRCVTIVARRHRLMAAVVPTVVDFLHDMTVGAGLWVTGEVGETLGLAEAQTTQSDDTAQRRRERQPDPQGKEGKKRSGALAFGALFGGSLLHAVSPFRS